MVEQVAQWIQEAQHTVIFTGAGMSTESGLPDFRSKDRGLWEKFNPNELANVHALIHHKEAFTDFYRYRLRELVKYKPHRGHYILAEWESKRLIDGIITQNVDAFHLDAGNKQVMELHGSFYSFYCHTCQAKHERQAYLDGMTTCACGGTIRPGIVLFGEPLDQTCFQEAEVITKQADLFIVLGSSLTVSPANMFPLLAKENGARLVIINREATDFDSYADLTIQDLSIQEALIAIDQAIQTR